MTSNLVGCAESARVCRERGWARARRVRLEAPALYPVYARPMQPATCWDDPAPFPVMLWLALCTENLLLDESGLLKISDFGLSALYTGAADDTSRATVCCVSASSPLTPPPALAHPLTLTRVFLSIPVRFTLCCHVVVLECAAPVSECLGAVSVGPSCLCFHPSPHAHPRTSCSCCTPPAAPPTTLHPKCLTIRATTAELRMFGPWVSSCTSCWRGTCPLTR